MSTTKETEGRNEEGAKEVKVNTVDYRSPAGEEEQGVKKENVEVIHRIDDSKDDKKETPGVIAQTAAKVAKKFQPAKEERKAESLLQSKKMSTTKETEGRNEEGAKEVKVNTVVYRSPAGEEEQGVKKENVEVIHRIDDSKDDMKETPGVIAQTAVKVAEKIQPAKEAISGSHDQKSE